MYPNRFKIPLNLYRNLPHKLSHTILNSCDLNFKFMLGFEGAVRKISNQSGTNRLLFCFTLRESWEMYPSEAELCLSFEERRQHFNSEYKTFFCHLTFSSQRPPGSFYPFHILTFAPSDTLQHRLRHSELSGGAQWALSFPSTLWGTSYSWHSNGSQPGILLCVSPVVSEMRQFHNDSSNLKIHRSEGSALLIQWDTETQVALRGSGSKWLTKALKRVWS